MDPHPGMLKEPQTLHKYSFAHGDPVNRIDPCGTSATMEYAIVTTQVSIRAQAQILAVGIAVTCLFYKVASAINPSIIPMIPPPFQACAVDTCARLLELCLMNPWQPPRRRKDWGPKKDCGACYRECKNDGGAWPFYKCPIFED
jgi:hypothetical protein